MSSFPVSRSLGTPRQTTHYLECGPAGGPLLIFVHGWPGVGLIWRAAMTAFAAQGWHCVAPDLRGSGGCGSGGSCVPAASDAYTVEEVVADMAPADFEVLVDRFEAHGFRPACAWYLNGDANLDDARRAPDGGRLSRPVLFVNGEWDGICSIVGNRQGDPMRAACADLTVTSIPAGHWLPLERKAELIEAIRRWLRSKGL